MSAERLEAVVDLSCSSYSPRLLPAVSVGLDLRFECNKPAHHGGDHAVALTWADEPGLFDDPPLWAGINDEADEVTS